MGPPSVSKANLKFPIFAATFAHNNPAVLIVGGGGGAGRSGVPNSICAFDTSSRAPTLEPFARTDLSRDEDSVTSLATASTKDGSIIYAGVNSSEENRLKGQNEHLRAYDLTYPGNRDSKAKETAEGRIEYLSKTQLFGASSETARKEGYQRLVKLSPPTSKAGGRRIGVVASSLQGDENELVIFPATSTKPSLSDVIHRIALKEKEANDVDILEPEAGRFQVAYCLDYSVYVQRFTYNFETTKPRKQPESSKAYDVSYPDAAKTKGRSKIRALRWLSPSHLLLLLNKPNRTGVEFQVLRLYSEDGMGSIILRKTLGRRAKQAVDMDVVRLNADSAGKFQAAIAVATQDVSLHIFTIDYNGRSFSGLAQYAVYADVHDVQMTKVVWSPFNPPQSAKTNSSQLLRLASTSLSGSVSVDTFELKSISSRPQPRFVLISSRTRKLYDVAIYAACAFIALMLALMVQSLLDPQGNWTKGIVPSHLQNAASGYKAPGVHMEEARAKLATDGHPSPVAEVTQRIRDLLNLHSQTEHEGAPEKALVIHGDPETGSALSAEVHEGAEDVVKKHAEAKRWEELSHEERKRWRDGLADAGMWAVEEGETILKGIFFSQAGALVGQVAHGVLNG